MRFSQGLISDQGVKDIKWSFERFGQCFAGAIIALLFLSRSPAVAVIHHLRDGKIEKYSEENVIVDEDISDIHFVSKPDEHHMLMMTDPKLKWAALNCCYGMDQIFLQKASYVKEKWGERYGKTHLIGFYRCVWDEDLLTQIELDDLRKIRTYDLLKELEAAEVDTVNVLPYTGDPLAVYPKMYDGRLQPCIVLSVRDYSDIKDISQQQLVIYTVSGEREITASRAFQKNHLREKSEKQLSWEEELKNIRGEEIYIHASYYQEGTAIVQTRAAYLDLEDPELLAVFPDLLSYDAEAADLITIYISDFPSNDEILSLITVR